MMSYINFKLYVNVSSDNKQPHSDQLGQHWKKINYKTKLAVPRVT